MLLSALAAVAAVSGVAFVAGLRLDIFDAGKRVEAKLEHRLDAMDKLMSSPFFLTVSFLAMLTVVELCGTLDDRWRAVSPTSTWCLSLYVAKMLLDVPMQLFTLRNDKTKLAQMFTHHVVSMVSIGVSLALDRCHFYSALALCSETSTIFLNSLMATKLFGADARPLGKKVVIFSGLLLWAAFLVFRIVLFPVWFYLFFYVDIRNSPELTWDTFTIFEKVLYPTTMVILTVLSYFWFVRITKGIRKELAKLGKSA